MSGVLLPYQAAWIRDTSQLKIMEKSRRIGLSWCMACEAVLIASAAGRAGMDVWYLGYTEDAGNDFMRDVKFWVDHLGKAYPLVDSEQDILTQSVRFSSGYRITSLTAKARNPRGKKGYFIIDEAAFHDDLPGLLKSALASVIWGGRVAIVSTHYGTESDFCKLITDVQSDIKKGSLHKITLDDAIHQGFYQRICEVQGKSWTVEGEKLWRDDLVKFYRDDADEELFCIPNEGGGAYITRSVIERCANLSDDGIIRLSGKSGVLNDTTTRSAIVQAWCDGEIKRRLSLITGDAFLGSDFARSSDLSVLVVGCKGRDGDVAFPLVIEMRNIPHEAQLQICRYVGEHVARVGGGAFDATGNGSYLAEAMNEKWRSIEPVTITTQWYVDTMPKLRAAFDNGKIAIVNDIDSIEDLGQIRLHGGIPKLTPLRRTTKTGARHGDFAIALALGYSAAINSLGAPTFTSRSVERSRPFERPERVRF